jgi:hypothetical protein
MAERITGMDELRAKLESLGDLTLVKGALIDAAKQLEGKLSQYPETKRLTRTEVYGQPFWALAAGKIEVPYHRGSSPGSERHKASWTTKMESDGLVARIGSNTSYGPYLQDPEKQSLYAKAVGWRTIDTIFEEESGGVVDLLLQAIDDTLDGG